MSRSPILCDLVLLTWNRVDLLRPCVERILRHTDVPSRLIVVDNGSADPEALAYLADLRGNEIVHPEILRRPQNGPIATALNEGLARCSAAWIGLLNNDILVTEGWLSEMIRVLQADQERGFVNPMSNQFRLWPSQGETVDGVALRLRGFRGQWVENAGCMGFCALLSRPAFQRVGYFDEAFQPMYFEDVDYSLRVRNAGFTCGIARGAYVYHHGSATIRHDPSQGRCLRDNAERFYRKWGRARPMRIACLLSPAKTRLDLPAIRDRIRGLANDDHDVWVFCAPETQQAVPEHERVRSLLLPRRFFLLAALWKLLIRKKRFHRVLTLSGRDGSLRGY